MSDEITRLPATRTKRPRDPFSMFFAWGLERLTKSLWDGDEYDKHGFVQLQIMARRCEAFATAFKDREEIEKKLKEAKDEDS